MAAKKRTSKADGMTADTYVRKSAAKSSRLRSDGALYNILEATLIDAGIPVSQAKMEAQVIMERAMKYGPSGNPKGWKADIPAKKKLKFSAPRKNSSPRKK